MKKILFISLAAILALSVGLIGCEGEGEGEVIPPEPESVVVGMSRDVMGIFELTAFGPSYRAYFDYVNSVSGGILLDEYGVDFRVPIEVLVKDDAFSTEIARDNTIALIEVDDVDFLFGACGTSFIYAQAPVANDREFVLMTAEGGATDLTSLLYGLPYVFVNLSFSDWYQLPLLADVLAEAGATKAYITWLSDLHGIEYKTIAEAEFGRVGIAVNASVAHSFGSREAEFTPIITEAQNNGCDVFCAFTYPDEVWAVTREAINQGYDPGAFICGPGANFGLYAAPPFSGLNITQIEGVMSFGVANMATTVAVGTPTMSMADMYTLTAAQIEADMALPPGAGMGILDWWGHPCYWASLEIWKGAVEEVGYVSQDLLKDALAGTESDPLPTIFGDTWYTMFGDGGGIMAYECHTGEIGQWISGVFEIIGPTNTWDSATNTTVPLTTLLPNYDVTAAYTYPIDLFPAG